MAAMTNDKKKTLAKDIYLLGQYTFEEIAEKVGSTRQTISKWCKEGQWEDLKAGMTVSREQILKGMYSQVNEINKAIQQKDAGQRYASPHRLTHSQKSHQPSRRWRWIPGYRI